MKTVELDGRRFSTLDELLEELGRVLTPGADWGRSLADLAEVLPASHTAGLLLRWVHSNLSRTRLVVRQA